MVFLFTGIAAFLNLQVNPFQEMRKKLYPIGWTLIGGLLVLISGDETAQIHESLAKLISVVKSQETGSQV